MIGWTDHLTIAPIVVPLLAGALMVLIGERRRTVDAARAVGMSELQIVRKVEVPLGLPLLIGGLRSATLQVVATATLAAYVADIGLGRYLFSGLKTRDYAEMLGGSILVILLALVLEGIFALIQWFVVPRGVSKRLGSPKTQTLRTGGPTAAR